MSSEIQVLAAINHLAAGFPSSPLAPETVRAYCEDLADLNPELLWSACKALRRKTKFFPAIGEIRAECERIRPEIPVYHRLYLPPPPEPEEVRMPPEARAAFDRLKEALAMEKRAKEARFDAERELWRQRSLRRAEREANQGGNP